jgi:tetratricopeptide (TPR) repeat protein
MKRTLVVTLVAGLQLAGCKEPQKAEAEARTRTSAQLVAEAKNALAGGERDRAVKLYKDAISASPQDASLYAALAGAYAEAGNEAAAVLTLKQAEQVSGQADPTLKRARAELFLKMHQRQNAIVEFVALRDAELLTDDELLDLTRLQMHVGKYDDAITTLSRLFTRSPDDPRGRTAEAEVQIARGDEVLGATRLDQILEAHPSLTDALVVRARYFLATGHPESAERDLKVIDAKDSRRADVLTLNASVLRKLNRAEEAATLLQSVVDENPQDIEVKALLAEVKLDLGQADEARILVEQVLTEQPKWARALYVKARSLELQGNKGAAQAGYEAAIKSDPWFAPAHSRLWVLSAANGEKTDAMATLETLFMLNEISADEKLALAGFYADTGVNVDRGQKLCDEALKRDPKNALAQKLKARLRAQASGGSGPVIIRGKRH